MKINEKYYKHTFSWLVILIMKLTENMVKLPAIKLLFNKI